MKIAQEEFLGMQDNKQQVPLGTTEGMEYPMAHSFVSCHVHYIFSTKKRSRLITSDIKERLWAYMGGVARENHMKAEAVGGTENHAHVLVSLPSTVSISKGIQLIKAGSSKWIHETFPECRDFAWQEGYGAFSVSISIVDATIAYITNQEEHHREKTFEEEYLAFLNKFNVEYKMEYVFD